MHVLFRTACPLPSLLGGVTGKGYGAAQGFGVPQRARSGAAGGWAVGESRGRGAERWPRPPA